MTIQHAEAFSMGIIHTIGAFVVYDEHFSNIYSKYSDGTGAAAQRSDWAVKLETAASRRRRAKGGTSEPGAEHFVPWLWRHLIQMCCDQNCG